MQKNNFKSDLYIVEGSLRSAIYDFKNKSIFLLNKAAYNSIKLRKSKSINIKNQTPKLYKKLLSLGIYDRINDITIINNDITENNNPEYNPVFAWLELTSKCNLNCIHCYSHSTVNDKKLNIVNCTKIIYDLDYLKLSTIQLTGGEILTNKKLLWDIVNFIRNETNISQIELYTNLTLLTNKDIDNILNYKTTIATTIYGHNPEVHDNITKVKGSFLKTINNFKKIINTGIESRMSCILMPANEKYVNEIIEFIKKNSFPFPKSPDYVRNIGKAKKFESNENVKKYRIGHIIDKDFLKKCFHGNCCWSGEIAILNNGNVAPCVFARDIIAGNVLNGVSLKNIIRSNKYKELAGLTKNNITKCKKCEFRYICFDCRALSYSQTGNIYGKPIGCNYDPDAELQSNIPKFIFTQSEFNLIPCI